MSRSVGPERDGAAVGVAAPNTQVIVGRAPDCDLVIDHPTVSARHARLGWTAARSQLVLEDLHSANGTFVRGERVARVAVRPGEDVRLGQVSLPWSAPALRKLLRAGAQGTALAPVLAPVPRASAGRRALGAGVGALVGVALLGVAMSPAGRARVERLRDRVGAVLAASPEEAYVRGTMMPQLRRALDPSEPVVRNTAVQIAARREGTFRVEQVAALWSHVHGRWRYVNDPRGREYVAMPKESIENEYAGDCDDFAVTLGAMVRAIGGEVRVVFMEGARGGHAYAEVCVDGPPAEVATKLARYYGRAWSAGVSVRRAVAYRSDSACPVWLNLDWNAPVPGGAYEAERWAVAAYADGRVEVLAPAPGATPTARARSVGTATAPRTAPGAP
jgi:hypothetical protein